MPRKWGLPLLRIFGTNWITLFGANLTTISAIAIVGFLLVGLLGLVDSPYIALMALLVLPGVFVFGLLLIPAGLLWEKQRKGKGVDSPEQRAKYPIIDLNNLKTRRVTSGVAVLTVLNILIISTVSYEGVAYMDSTEFCGQVCHTVMNPEFTTYKNSPHSRVNCVECHIGPGAPWFVRSKLSGMGQVLAVTFDSYERPVPTPIKNLRPSQIICEQCHWPGKFTGDRIKVITRYSDDEANTPLKTVLALHIGGGHQNEGIHSWHIDPERQTTYISTDRQRQNIAWIKVEEPDQTIEYRSGEGVTDEMLAQGERRTMDCVDCHNRPTHIYRLPGDAMDEALLNGSIDPSIPYIKKTAVEALTEVGEALGSSDEVRERLFTFYQKDYPDLLSERPEAMEAAFTEVVAIYERNVFPDMKLTWGTYPDNIGHQNYPGCFRCHDGEHSSEDGHTIDQDCEACHTILAWDEEDPEILQQLGLQ